jgi:hypothetical protein
MIGTLGSSFDFVLVDWEELGILSLIVTIMVDLSLNPASSSMAVFFFRISPPST